MKVTRMPKSIMLILVTLLTTHNSRASLTIIEGTASAGADFASSPSLSVPPSGPTSTDVFYDFRDLNLDPVNLTGLQAGGWANCTWQINTGETGSIVFDGSSGQGFNGSYGPGGYLYSWGHATFLLEFAIDQTYTFTDETPADNIQFYSSGGGLISDESGVLSPGDYTISASTYGDSGGFAGDISFTPTPIPEPDMTGVLAALLCLGGIALSKARCMVEV